jgi:hypothetical protein
MAESIAASVAKSRTCWQQVRQLYANVERFGTNWRLTAQDAGITSNSLHIKFNKMTQ